MSNLKHHSSTLIFVGFIAASLLVGWLIPAFYAWTDSDQSRPSPLLWQLPLTTAILAFVFCVALPWLPISSDHTNAEPRASVRYRFHSLLLIATGVAIMIAVPAKFPLVGAGIVTVGMVAYFIQFWLRYPQHRLAASSLIACMILPYAWIVAYKHFGQIFQTVMALIGIFPTFYPANWICYFAGIPFRESPGLGFLLTALELVGGLWLIRLGPKRTIAYLLLVVLVSAMGSLSFYQAVRA